MSGYLTSADLAQELGCSDESIRRAILRGDLRAFKYGRLVRISRDEADRFLAAHTATPPKTTRRSLRSTA